MVDVTSSDSPKRQTNGFFVTISAVLALLANRASRLSGTKLKPKPKPMRDDDWKVELRSSPKKKLLSNISSKALLPFVHNHNHNHNHNHKKKNHGEDEEAAGWGHGGVWQKEILMGGKCEPLDFSGVIYYDGNGKQTNEVPLRSPRASPMPGYLTRLREQRLS